MKGYNDFNNVDELIEYYNLNINESINKDNDSIKYEKENNNINLDKSHVVKTEKLEVNYAKPIKKYTNIFKHIVIFTNDNDKNRNKTLNNIYEAVQNLKKSNCEIIPEIHVFIAAEIDINETDNIITIYDSDNKFVIKNESNIDTLIFSRLGVQNEDNCEHIVQILQDRGFLVLNPIKYSALACDKYDSAILFEKGGIPQPRFTLMTKDILYDTKLYNEAMRNIYPDWDDKDNDKNADKKIVIKILNGHGGTGVAMLDGKNIFPVLQLIFAIDKERNILLQRKEEADGGDIRVHVLTLRNHQYILGAMKRIKIKNDFRSNVSLGATAETVKLTPEQEQIALKTAQLSRLPWCAVDIMPLVKGSNPEIGDNVVLEINASPGTDGISEVLKENFINILLNNLTDPGEFYLQDKFAGFIESIDVNFGVITKKFLAKLDTGNSCSCPTIEVGNYDIKDNKIIFKIDGTELKFDYIRDIKVIAGEKSYIRPTINIPEVTLGLRKIKNVEFAIVNNRDKKTTNCLLNREILSKLGYVIHPNKTHILTKEIEKVKII